MENCLFSVNLGRLSILKINKYRQDSMKVFFHQSSFCVRGGWSYFCEIYHICVKNKILQRKVKSSPPNSNRAFINKCFLSSPAAKVFFLVSLFSLGITHFKF